MKLLIPVLILAGGIYFATKGNSSSTGKTDAQKRAEIKAHLASTGERSDWVDKLSPAHLNTLYDIWTQYVVKKIKMPPAVLTTFWGILEQYGIKYSNS